VTGMCVGLASLLGLYWFQEKMIKNNDKKLLSAEHLEKVYSNLYDRDVSDNPDFNRSLWNHVYSHFASIREYIDLSSIPTLKPKEMALFEKIMNKDIPYLRKQAIDCYVNGTPTTS
jgi:hypothetical protein